MTLETDSPPMGTGDDFAAEVAERVTAEADAPKRRGRPPGSTNRKKKEPEKPAIFVANVTPGDVEIAGQMFDTVWGFIAPIARLAPLDERQRLQAGTAFAPLIQKYMPLAGNWQYEIMALLTLGAIVMECKKNYVPPRSVEEIEHDNVEPAVKRDQFGRAVV